MRKLWQCGLTGLKKRVLAVLLACIGFNALPAYALIFGSPQPATAVSTVRLAIQHAHYLRSVDEWEYYDSTCSAVVVGRKPLTLITAAHCLKEVKLASPQNLPTVSIMQADQLGIAGLNLKQAFYRPYQDVVDNLTSDIAVLVFDGQAHQALQPVSILLAKQKPETLLLCGYGQGYLEQETNQPRCAERVVMQSPYNFSKVLAPYYQPMDEMLYIKSLAQFQYTQELAHSEKALLAVNRLGKENQYDALAPMPTEGDSGGPWLHVNKNGQYELLAITSFVERFYNKSPYWSFFDKETPLADYPYIAYGLRLNHPKVISFLQYARRSGADIRFIQKK